MRARHSYVRGVLGQLLWVLSHLLLLPTTCASVLITVDSAADGWPDAANCQSNQGSTCNLRSAFELCVTLGSAEDQCVIDLPVGEVIPLDLAYGPRLTLTNDCNILIRGNNATVSRIGFTELSTVELGGAFPLATGTMTDTASATKNYQSACTEGCGGDALVFTGCNYDKSQDAYYRLYSGSTEVARNDDYCESMSYIQYSVPDNAACSQYCLRAGCWSSSTCTTTVQAYLTAYIPFNMLYYLASSGDVSVPRLAIEDLTIRGFDGAVRLIGDVQLDLNRVTFDGNQHDEGGAIYLDDNSRPVRVVDCVFTGNSAMYGGRSVLLCTSTSCLCLYGQVLLYV